jgi:hypothetical protein
MAVWKVDPTARFVGTRDLPLRPRAHSFSHRRVNCSAVRRFKTEDLDSHPWQPCFPTRRPFTTIGMVQYDYAFDVSEDTKVDAITLPWGANHPCSMWTMVTTILDSIYAYGSLSAREMLFWTPLKDDASATFYVLVRN